MTLALKSLAALALALAVRGVWLGQERLRHTTLLPAGRWALAAALAWTATFSVSLTGKLSAAGGDALWYLTALLAVCPAIAVLGARRPGGGVWSAFVIVPLLAVLGWPLLTLTVGGGEFRALRLETPQLIGFVLVLLMGAGNYMGTRFSLLAVAYVVSLCLLVGSVSAVAPPLVQGSVLARELATICLGLAVVGARRVLRQQTDDPVDPSGSSTAVGASAGQRDSAIDPALTPQGLAGFDLLWADYRDTFGIVWAKRFQDRLNGIAAQQKWPARLGDRGIEWDTAPGIDRRQVSERIDQSFRWLLRRFVDPPWIEERLRRPITSVDGQSRSPRN